jgi:hypothetical protein
VALTITEAGKANSTTSSSSLTVTLTASFAVGDTVFAIVAADNAGTNGASSTSGISDSKSNTWTTAGTQNHDPGAANAGTTLSVFLCHVTTALTTSDTLTVNFSPDTTSKAILVWKLVAPSGYKASVYATSGNAQLSTSLNRSMTINAGNSAIGAQGWATNATVTADGDITRGAWSTLYSEVADTGTSSTSMTVVSQWKNPTGGTTAQNFTTSVAANTSTAIILFELTEVLSVTTRTATGSGTGSEYAAIQANPSGNQVSDFQFAFVNTPGYFGRAEIESPTRYSTERQTSFASAYYDPAPAFFLGVSARLATGSGAGTQTASGLHIAPRTATGSGSGSASVAYFEILSRSATGSGAGSSGGGATRLVINIRTATGSGAGTHTDESTFGAVRQAFGSGTGESVAAFRREHFRASTGSGAGTETGSGRKVYRRTATGSGTGSDTAATWAKVMFFRPPTDDVVRWADYQGYGIANRFFRYLTPGERGKNVYKLTNGTYTENEQRDPSVVVKIYYGGHENPITQQEKEDLTAAGYGAYVS